MTVEINGETKIISDGTSITQLLTKLSINHERVVVECNRVIVNKDNYTTTLLNEGDTLEIIQFVPGG